MTIEFSNNPKDDTSADKVYDETRHYTFDIDGQLWGDTTKHTNEVVKVGLDSDGNPIEQVTTIDNGTQHAVLDGAVFGLYTAQTQDEEHLYKNRNYPNGCTITTANGGLMTIQGLDAGTYYLKEISAPDGYIKDQQWHTVTINAVTSEKDCTKEIDGKTVSYKVTTLDSYTIDIDGTATTYTMTLTGPDITEVSTSNTTKEIVNTKGVELPSTGGIGTTIFYISGIVLVLGAAAILVARRKAEQE